MPYRTTMRCEATHAGFRCNGPEGHTGMHTHASDTEGIAWSSPFVGDMIYDVYVTPPPRRVIVTRHVWGNHIAARLLAWALGLYSPSITFMRDLGRDDHRMEKPTFLEAWTGVFEVEQEDSWE